MLVTPGSQRVNHVYILMIFHFQQSLLLLLLVACSQGLLCHKFLPGIYR